MKTSAVAALLSSVGLVQAVLPIPWNDISGSNVNPPTRKDITQTNWDEYSLFILAMQKWQTTSRNEVGGYFQVCGIHGAPHGYWDNASGSQRTGEGAWDMGFCWHEEQNFYLWHRPYLALFEQQMRAVAKDIADNWYQPQRQQYQAAWRGLRLPYWDWANGANGVIPGTVPNSIQGANINVISPTTGQMTSIRNPLVSHTLVTGQVALDRYHNGNGPIYVGTGNTPGTTYRSGSYTRDMVAQGSSLRRWTAQLLLTPNICWNQFTTYDNSERDDCGAESGIQSLEGIHNTVHNTVCGTMCNLDTAAFDPIFWLHHANVDRIGAIWQFLNPNTKVRPTVAASGNWVYNSGVTRDDSFKMLPFRWSGNDGDWWQPKWLYDTRNNGYIYPELAGNPSRETVINTVNKLYGNGRSQLAVSSDSRRRVKRSQRLALLQYRQEVAASAANLTSPPPADALASIGGTLIKSNGSFDEYTVKCTISKSVAPGKSFNLHLFLGDVDKDRVSHSDYLTAPNRIGGMAVSQSGGAAFMKMDNLAEGLIPVTDGLLHMVLIGNLKDMKPATVSKYVKAKLVWRLVTSDGQDIGGKSRSHRLKISVQHRIVTPDDGSALAPPVISNPDQLVDTTNGTSAKPLPSGVAATTLTATATGAAETGAGPVPLPTGDAAAKAA